LRLSSNVLIDGTRTADIADTGLILLSESDVFYGRTPCWTSPELLDPLYPDFKGRSTREPDCRVLGMVIYEVLVGCQPRHHLTPTPSE